MPTCFVRLITEDKMEELKTMFNWNEDKIYWNIVCCETNDMDEKICNEIKDYIKNKNVAELGCGTGYFSLAMSKYANIVVSTDIQDKVLDVLEKNIKKHNIKNIIPIRSNVYKNVFHNVDYIVAKFFSRPSKDVKLMLDMTDKGVILIKNTTSDSGMNQDEASKFCKENALTIIPYLEKEKIKYKKIDMECENGQYVRDEDEGIRFLKSYTQNNNEQIKDILKKSKLSKGYKALGETFTYFISVYRRFSIFIIEK